MQHFEDKNRAVKACSEADLSSRSKRRVCIIGAGLSGLVAARYFSTCTDVKWEVDVFEKKPSLGGIWNYKCDTAAYWTLVSNLPRQQMELEDFPVSEDLPGFLPHEDFLRYLEAYADFFSLKRLIHFNTEILSIFPVSRHSVLPQQCKISDEQVNPTSVKDFISREEDGYSCPPGTSLVNSFETLGNGSAKNTEIFRDEVWNVDGKLYDAVVVASGHFEKPHDTGDSFDISEFEDHVIHAVRYKRVEPFTSMRVLVVGSGPSGADIAREVARVAEVVYWCNGDFKDAVRGGSSAILKNGSILRDLAPNIITIGGFSRVDRNGFVYCRLDKGNLLKDSEDDATNGFPEETAIFVHPPPVDELDAVLAETLLNEGIFEFGKQSERDDSKKANCHNSGKLLMPEYNHHETEISGKGALCAPQNASELRQVVVDKVILATGYDYDFRFLPEDIRDVVKYPTGKRGGGCDKTFADGLFLALVSKKYPRSLFFPGMPFNVIPVMMIDTQIKFILKLANGEIPISCLEKCENYSLGMRDTQAVYTYTLRILCCSDPKLLEKKLKKATEIKKTLGYEYLPSRFRLLVHLLELIRRLRIDFPGTYKNFKIEIEGELGDVDSEIKHILSTNAPGFFAAKIPQIKLFF